MAIMRESLGSVRALFLLNGIGGFGVAIFTFLHSGFTTTFVLGMIFAVASFLFALKIQAILKRKELVTGTIAFYIVTVLINIANDILTGQIDGVVVVSELAISGYLVMNFYRISRETRGEIVPMPAPPLKMTIAMFALFVLFCGFLAWAFWYFTKM